MITSCSRVARVTALVGLFPLALMACASNPSPRHGLTARADTGSRSDATSSRPSGVETPQQASSSGTLQISDEIRAACGIGRGDAFFPLDSYRLRTQDVPALNKVATCFTSGALKGRTMQLVGHADPRGASEYNMALGMNRADAVAGYLHRQGVAASQTETTSRGAIDATGTSEAGWAQDRRVDVMLGR